MTPAGEPTPRPEPAPPSDEEVVATRGGPLRVTTEPWLGAPARSYPDRPRTVVDALDLAVTHHGDAEAVVDRVAGRRRSVTWAQLGGLVEGAVGRLRAQGLARGDRLAIAAPNSLDLLVALLACARGGFVMIGLDDAQAPAAWADRLAGTGTRLALGWPGRVERLDEAASRAGLPVGTARRLADHVVGADDPTGATTPWRGAAADRPSEHDTFALVHTSGSTGRPKASRLVHRAAVHSGMSYRWVLGLDGHDRSAVWFWLGYVSALHAHVLPMMLVGGCCALVGTPDLTALLDTMATERITWAYSVPSTWRRLADDDRLTAAALPHLRLAAAGGAPFPVDRLRDLRRRLPDVGWVNVYGLTETHSPATMLGPGEWAGREGSVGRPLPCMEARVVVGDHVAGPDEPGMLQLRGSLVTSGYEGDDDATRAAIRDGWLTTGDVARIDPAGYVWISDRADEAITRGGRTIWPAEIERVLREHAGVRDAAVLGVTDRVAGQAVAAFVVADDVTAGDLRRWVVARLGRYARPRHVTFLDDLPRTTTGKVDRVRLRTHDTLTG